MRYYLFLLLLLSFGSQAVLAVEPEVVALRKAAIRKYGLPATAPASAPELLDMGRYRIVNSGTDRYAMTRTSVRGPSYCAVWQWQDGGWTQLFSYQDQSEQFCFQPDLQGKMDKLYASHGLNRELRLQLEDFDSQTPFPALNQM